MRTLIGLSVVSIVFCLFQDPAYAGMSARLKVLYRTLQQVSKYKSFQPCASFAEIAEQDDTFNRRQQLYTVEGEFMDIYGYSTMSHRSQLEKEIGIWREVLTEEDPQNTPVVKRIIDVLEREASRSQELR